jgi:electron transfer flavoprotein beta subunit
MKIIVCVKRVPKTAEADLFIEKEGKDIKKDNLVFALNDWDGYAIREAVRIKENFGGEVVALTVGPEDSKEVLTRCLAMGADRALRIEEPPAFDALLIAKILARAIQAHPFDLILTGVQTEDDGWGQVGVALAQLLGIPHASIVNRIEIENEKAKVKRELEGGLEELLEVKLPALFTIQTGINEPKYVSLAAILEAEEKEMREIGLEELGLTSKEPLYAILDQVSFPPAGKMAEILKGTPEEVVTQLSEIIKKRKG